MTVYIIAQLKITEPDAYRRYQRAFPAIFSRHNGQLLVADPSPSVLEGEWPRDKVVVMAFPDQAAAERFVHDPDYQTISKDRAAGAETVSLMVKGLEPALR